ncbi:hypothetical protein FEM33_12210 [Dyadobacter flavalbus]|uniref:DUF6644 domain-containing protein n=1 Tax=Dyadobacter flavalbus TaxID=2579942 RepID=A0A5M8QTB8_9BACT|nr:hypothetical protein FEM33_12210 [Dyadobacter flavalbus]
MSPTAAEFLQWLESASWAVHIRQSLWLYPALEIVHITGIAILVGAAFLFDLRLLGFSENLPVSGLANHLLPWSKRGLWLIVPSGLLLFITNAETLGKDPTFWLKMLLLVIAGLNALVFHKLIYPSRFHSEPEKRLPFPAKISASISITVWIAVIACGRLLAY